MPIESVCGADCKAAIDAARSFIVQVRRAVGRGSQEERRVIEACRVVTDVYING
jgi:hypothetical protein